MVFKQSILAWCLLTVICSSASEITYVKDKDAAIGVGEAFLVAIYGKTVLDERPFKLTSNKETWIMEGTLNCGGPPTCFGGVALIEFRKKDGAILRVTHGK